MKSALFNGKTFVSLDLETTGLKPNADRIIEIGAVKWKDGKVIDTWDTLVNPGIKLTNLSEAITGINENDLKKAPMIGDIGKAFHEFVGDAAVVGHNVQFDIDFLKANGVDLTSNPRFDTYELGIILLPEMPSYSLQTLTKELGIQQPVAHRAYHDSVSALELFTYLIDTVQEIPRKVLEKIVREVRKTNWHGGEIFLEALVHGTEHSPSRFVREARKKKKVSKHLPEGSWEWDAKSVAAIFDSNGALKKYVPGFTAREAQQKMAAEVTLALENEHNLVAEAGTGTGKTLAYLLPMALRSISLNERAIVATYTIALQEQIRDGELEIVRSIVRTISGTELRVAFMKGRSHYLCRNRFEQFRSRGTLFPEEVRLSIKVLLWLERGETFERSELAIAHGEEMLWEQICSDSTFCREKQCTEGDGCAIQHARRRAEEAHLIITTQALLVSDMRYQQTLLPSYSFAVVDEAHHLADVTTEQCTVQLRSNRWDALCRDVLHVVDTLAAHGCPVSRQTELREIAASLLERGPIFFGLIGIFTQHLNENVSVGFRLDALIDAAARESFDWHKIDSSGGLVLESLRTMYEVLARYESNYSGDAAFANAFRTVEEAVSVLEGLLTPSDDIVQTTIQNNGSVRIAVSPLSVAPFLQDKLYAGRRSVILTSATLTVDQRFEYFRRANGLDDSWNEFIAPSVFNFTELACLILPKSFPNPASSNYPVAISKVVTDVVAALGGKTLLLLTSFREVERLYAELTLHFRGNNIDVLAQNLSGRREKLTAAFKASDRAVLIGTSSFWEGIDVPGKNLSCVIIPKLPFEVPSDPIFQARSRQYENGFIEYAVPRSVITLRQGVGRLIRSVTDKGVVILLDTRLQERAYGEIFLKSLPPMPMEVLERDEIASAVASFIHSS